MYRAIFLIDRRGMHILYYPPFLPYMMYCAEVWSNTYATNVQCLVILQKKVIRLLCGDCFYHLNVTIKAHYNNRKDKMYWMIVLF